MKLYVYAEAFTPIDEDAYIVQTQVFKSLEDAKEYLKKQIDAWVNYDEDEADKWHIKERESGREAHLTFRCSDGGEEYVAMAIEEHEI